MIVVYHPEIDILTSEQVFTILVNSCSPTMSDTQSKLQKIKKFYTANRRLPTYTEMLHLFDYSSRNAVFKLVHKWIQEELLEKTGNRLAPTENFFALPVL